MGYAALSAPRRALLPGLAGKEFELERKRRLEEYERAQQALEERVRQSVSPAQARLRRPLEEKRAAWARTAAAWAGGGLVPHSNPKKPEDQQTNTRGCCCERE